MSIFRFSTSRMSPSSSRNVARSRLASSTQRLALLTFMCFIKPEMVLPPKYIDQSPVSGTVQLPIRLFQAIQSTFPGSDCFSYLFIPVINFIHCLILPESGRRRCYQCNETDRTAINARPKTVTASPARISQPMPPKIHILAAFRLHGRTVQ